MNEKKRERREVGRKTEIEKERDLNIKKLKTIS